MLWTYSRVALGVIPSIEARELSSGPVAELCGTMSCAFASVGSASGRRNTLPRGASLRESKYSAASPFVPSLAETMASPKCVTCVHFPDEFIR